MTTILRQSGAGLRLLIVFTVLLGILYPLAGLAVGRLLSDRADGSLLEVDGRVVGSSLIGQQMQGDQWFIPRPSAAGDGYDAMASGGSNLGPNNPDLVQQIQERKAEVAAREGVSEIEVPADAVTASASGLDPLISVDYARLQVPRVARERGLSQAEVLGLVDVTTQSAGWGFLGEPGVNVVQLNAALEKAQ